MKYLPLAFFPVFLFIHNSANGMQHPVNSMQRQTQKLSLADEVSRLEEIVYKQAELLEMLVKLRVQDSTQISNLQATVKALQGSTEKKVTPNTKRRRVKTR
jgi:hypothetical protein